jgi:hypothetical protein
MHRLELRQDAVIALDAAAADAALHGQVETTPIVALHPTFVIPALEVEVALMRDVIATLGDAGPAAYNVACRPAGGGTFPRLFGTLHVVPNGPSRCTLRLDAWYDDPSAKRADRSGAEMGFRIVQALGRALLERVRHAICAIPGATG